MINRSIGLRHEDLVLVLLLVMKQPLGFIKDENDGKNNSRP